MDISTGQLQKINEAVLGCSDYTLDSLQEAADHISTAYRNVTPSKALIYESHILSYVATRMPATQGVVKTVLKMLPTDEIHSLLDLGSGPGTVLWAANTVLTSLQTVVVVEQNTHMIAIAQRIAATLIDDYSYTIDWRQDNLTMVQNLPQVDLVTISYALNEIDERHYLSILKQAFDAAQRYIVVIEPGTPSGFANINKARSYLMEQGGYTMAPCTHHQPCPLTGNDWCHFSKRITRSNQHRRIKNVNLTYEDEKYSYIIIAKQNPNHASKARIVKQPLRRSGHIRLDLCDNLGVYKNTVSRKDGRRYKKARSADWGDLWDTMRNDNKNG